MKKLTAILLALALLFSFAGCVTQEDIDKAVNDASAPLKEQIDRLNADIAAKEAKIETLEDEKADLTAEKTTLEGEIDEVDAQIATLNGKVAELEASGEADDQEIAKLKGDISTLEGKKTELSGKVTELENSISAKDAEITGLHSSIQTLTTEKQTLTDRVEELEKENATLENEKTELEKENAGLKNCLAGEHAYSYTDNHEKTHKGTCIWCDDTTVEAHSFADGACSVCGIAGGYCGTEGENAVWTLKDGAFTLSGIGEVRTYGLSAIPWREHKYQIESATVNDGITNLPQWAFYNTTVKTVTLPGSVTTIGANAFYFCVDMESITLSEGLQSIGDTAFRNCSALKSITIPASVTSISSNALDADLEEILVAEGNPVYRSIDGNLYAFDGDALTLMRYADGSGKDSFVTPAGVRAIDREAFAYAYNLVSLTISEDVDEVRRDVFLGCHFLTKLTILSRSIHIDADAFCMCDNLRDIYYVGTQEQWDALGIELPEGATVHYNYIAQ